MDTMDREAMEPLFDAVADAFDTALADIIEQARATSCNLYPNFTQFYTGLEKDDAYAALDMMKENYPAFSFAIGKDLETAGLYVLTASLF